MDKAARFAALFRAHQDAVHRVGLRYGRGRRAFADDIVQETFLKAWENIDGIREDAGGWLYVVATRLSLSRLRKEAVRNNPLVAWLMPLPTASKRADDVVEVAAEAAASLAQLDALPPKQRVAFWMVHVDEKPLADVAATLQCSIGYASKLVSRAEEALRVHAGAAATGPKGKGGAYVAS
jgi:RNA polymerase sigma-70 factor (ECF subfamily)